ncbi:MAG: hypothetical protein KDC24_14155 [Saprospiraceae bacterium]|nr:hypothetical protein [Saprospiraceae bacterium]
MNKRLFLLTGLLGCTLFLFAQDQTTSWSTGIEIQAYPTGQIFGLTIEKMWNEKHAGHIRLGYNRVRHGDAGVHDEESGGGLGATFGYRRYFDPAYKAWHMGIRTDLWYNTIDWTDEIIGAPFKTGTTNIVVVQPTLEGGYTFLSKNNWTLDLSLAFGIEINVYTDGEPTGEGLILLGGLTVGKRF